MSKLASYSRRATEIREHAKRNGLTDREINRCIREVVGEEVSQTPKRISDYVISALKVAFAILFAFACGILLIYVVVSCHNPTQKFVTRWIQNWIYPVMRLLRLYTLPLHRTFPTLTEWHEEECLVKNPFYQNPDLVCWPCDSVQTVIHVHGFKNFSQFYYHNGTPVIVKDTSQEEVSMETLKKLWVDHTDALRKGSTRFRTSHPSITTPNELFERDILTQKDFIIFWRFGRVPAARALRNVFQRPYFVPNSTEVALERFIIIAVKDTHLHHLPLTDFANVWIIQGYGNSNIILEPSPHCKQSCQPVSTQLQPKDVLFYNWQFWRPLFSMSPQSNISIIYMGSFY